jgi:pyruvate/2-oxoglutarate dehydrogenase complex dihydrolipoamide dehydrogenase (E3) component
VTVVERNGALIHREDRDVTDAIEEVFRGEGIEVATGTAVRRVEGVSGESVRLQATRSRADVEIEGTHLLVAGGRTPNTDGIGLDAAGVETDERGHVRVNERLQTTAKDVWAVGDCAGSPYFTHIGFDDFRVVRDNGAFAVGNQTSDPQCGQGASALGHEGDNRSRRRQTGQRLGCPSGVREDIVIWSPNGFARRPAAAAITDSNLQSDF